MFHFKNKMFLLSERAGSSGKSHTFSLNIRIIDNVIFLTFVGYMETDFKHIKSIMFHSKFTSFIHIL